MQNWCTNCSSDTFCCDSCDRRYPIVETADCDITDDTLCRSCYEENYRSCEECSHDVHNDNSHNVGDYEYCESCYNELFFYCQACEEDRGRDDYSSLPLANGSRSGHDYICSQCWDERLPGQFERCPHTNHVINTHNFGTYYIIENRMVSRTWAVAQYPSATIRSFDEQMQHYAGNRIGSALFRPQRNIGSLQSLLLSKVKNDLSNRPAPTVSPVHTRIYIGLEIEAQGGKLVSWTKSKAPQGKSLDMGPHRLLSRTLPPGTRMVRDGSIRGDNGQEFLPPIVKKKTDWRKIEQTIKALKELDWKSNDSCGLHMHFSHADISPDNPKLVKEIFRIFYFLEPVLFQCLPPARRNNDYCKPIATYFKPQEIKQDIKLDYWYYGNFWKKRIRRRDDHNGHPTFYRCDSSGHPVDGIGFGEGKLDRTNLNILKSQDHYFVGRYIGCNLHALYQKGTIELRYFPSILEFSYVYAWARLMAQVFSYALKGGNHDKVEAITANTTLSIPERLQALAKLFGWKPAMVNFLATEYKTYRGKPSEGHMDMITGEMREPNPDPENRRLQHLAPAILSQDPIPTPSPLETQPAPATISIHRRYTLTIDPATQSRRHRDLATGQWIREENTPDTPLEVQRETLAREIMQDGTITQDLVEGILMRDLMTSDEDSQETESEAVF